MKYIKLYEAFINEKLSKKEELELSDFISDMDPYDLFELCDDLFDGAKNNRDKDEKIELVINKLTRMGTNVEELKSKLDLRKNAKSAKEAMKIISNIFQKNPVPYDGPTMPTRSFNLWNMRQDDQTPEFQKFMKGFSPLVKKLNKELEHLDIKIKSDRASKTREILVDTGIKEVSGFSTSHVWVSYKLKADKARNEWVYFAISPTPDDAPVATQMPLDEFVKRLRLLNKELLK